MVRLPGTSANEIHNLIIPPNKLATKISETCLLISLRKMFYKTHITVLMNLLTEPCLLHDWCPLLLKFYLLSYLLHILYIYQSLYFYTLYFEINTFNSLL